MLLCCRGHLKSPWSRRRRKHALLPKQWKTFFDEDGRLCDGGVKFLKKVRSGVCCCYLIIVLNTCEIVYLCFMFSFNAYFHLLILSLITRFAKAYIFFLQGVHPSLRAEVWPFLLGV